MVNKCIYGCCSYYFPPLISFLIKYHLFVHACAYLLLCLHDENPWPNRNRYNWTVKHSDHYFIALIEWNSAISADPRQDFEPPILSSSHNPKVKSRNQSNSWIINFVLHCPCPLYVTNFKEKKRQLGPSSPTRGNSLRFGIILYGLELNEHIPLFSAFINPASHHIIQFAI